MDGARRGYLLTGTHLSVGAIYCVEGYTGDLDMYVWVGALHGACPMLVSYVSYRM